MIRLIQFLFSGCFHQWEVINRQRTDNDFNFYDLILSSGTADTYTLRCKKCGAMKTFLAK